MPKITLCLLILLLVTLGAHSAPLMSEKHLKVKTYPQEMQRSYTVADGLPSDDVRAIGVMGDGKVYAGTDKGLAVWDGDRWNPVANSPMDIQVLATDAERLYVATSMDVHVLEDGAFAVLVADLPGVPTALSVKPPSLSAPELDGALVLATRNGLFVFQDGVSKPIKVINEYGQEVVEFYDVGAGTWGLIVATPDGALMPTDLNGYTKLSKVIDAPDQIVWRLVLPLEQHTGWAPRFVRCVLFDEQPAMATNQGVATRNEDGEWTLYTGADGLPYDHFTSMDYGPDGRLWLGTTKGAIHYRYGPWAYRAGKRWLPNDAVRDIAATADGAWIATAGGVGHIYFKPMTFAEKAEHFESEIDTYGRRTPYEYVSGVRLEKAGDRSKWTQHDTDNDGQYTGLYGAAECLAYGATGDPKAKARATKTFEALAFLSEVTQSGSNPAPRGFIARTILPTDGPDPNEHNSPEHDRKKREGDALWKVLIPRWPTSGDGKWYWKTDASSDELDGHFLLYALYYDHVAETEAEKAAVREVCSRVMDHLIEHDFRLVDHDGTPTRWGNFSPESLNGDPDWWTERGLNSLSLLTYLTVTHHVTGEQKYRDVFMELVEKHHYALNGMVMPKLQFGPGSHVQFDDKMAFMNYYNLIRYEEDPEVLRMFQNSIFYYWQIVRQEKNPFFNFVYAALCEGQGMQTQWGVTDLSPTHNWLEDSVDTLKRFPMDLVLWPTINSHRIDLIPLGSHTREPGKAEGHGYRVDGYVIPIDERNALSFSEDTWKYDDKGGNGKYLEEGSPFLLGYYLGLYHGFIVD